jgi:predicted TIM-barrel fold metal-dependent hydrolase
MAPRTLVESLFLESRVDVAATHTLRLDSWFHDGFSARAKTEALASAWPNRMIGYVGLDATQPLEHCIADLDEQLERLPHAAGLKLYPHQIDPYRRFRADDPGLIELFRHACVRGLRTVAIHKALPNGPVPLAPYAIEDMEVACDTLPEMNFEIVHAGMAFLEETALALARYPNVYCNLETTTALLWRAPGQFEEILARLMFFGGPARILFASGFALVHPQHLIELFWNFSFSEAVLRKYGLPQIGEAEKRMILGENYARMIGRDPAAMKAAVQHDAFSEAVRRDGLRAPFSSWRNAA